MCEIFFGETSKIFHTYWKHFTHSKRFHTYWSHLGLGVEHADMLGKHKFTHTCLTLGWVRGCGCAGETKNIYVCLTLNWVRECGCAGWEKKSRILVSLWVWFGDVDVLAGKKTIHFVCLIWIGSTIHIVHFVCLIWIGLIGFENVHVLGKNKFPHSCLTLGWVRGC